MIDSLTVAPEIEELLRASAPQLPLAHKKRTLNQISVRIAERRHREHRLQWQMTWVVAGVLALQGIALFFVDAQNTRLVSGDSTPTPYTPITVAQVTAAWHQRSRQIAMLSHPFKIG